MSTLPSARRRTAGAFAAAFLVLQSGLLEAEPASTDPQVIVTASRLDESLDESLWSATVLTREEIEIRQPNSVQDLLAGMAGVGFDNSGGLGKSTNVRIRGAESDQTLLLIDGVRVGSATLGIPPFEFIPVDQIERIEVVRGPRSTLYGSDAVGGVVQIITRDGTKQGLRFGFNATGESHGTHRVGGTLRAAGERAWLDIGASTMETDGINSCLGLPFPPGGGCFTDEPDRDGFRSNSGSLAAGWRFNDRLSMELRSLITDGHTEFDGSFTNEADFSERVTSLHLDSELNESWNARVMLGRTEDVQENFFGDTPAERYKTRRDTASVQIDGSFANGLRALVGTDYQDDRVSSNVDFAGTSRATHGVFTELRADRGPWSLLAGARLEDNEQFGTHTVGNAGLARKLTDEARVSLTWGTAFRAPTFNELYFPGFGDPNLAPEESRSLELGFDGFHGDLRWSLHAFETRFDEMIAFDVATFSPKNIGAARIRGAELQGDWQRDAWRIGARYTWLDPENRSADMDGLALPRRARHSGSLDIRHVTATRQLGARVRVESSRFDDLANTVRLGGFTTLDLFGEQRLGRSWTVQARIANVFDRDYSTAYLFNQEGRYYSVTLRYHHQKD